MTESDSVLSRTQGQQHRLTSTDSAATAVHGDGPLARINKWLAVRITEAVGTMWCAYIFAILALVSLPAAIESHNAVVLVSWLSQTFLQLVLLSIIIVGQQVLAEASDERAESDHETLELLRQINVTQLQLLNELHAAVEERRARESASGTGTA